MNTLQSSFYAVAIFSCLLCAFVVGGKRAPKRFNFLIAYLVLESLRYVFQWLMIQPAAPAKSLWLGSLMISSFLVAPALWMFAREIAEGRSPPLRSLRGPHLAVILAGVLLTVPLLLRTYGGTEFGDPNNPESPMHKLFINSTMLAAVILFLCQVPYYLTACVRLLATARRSFQGDVLRHRAEFDRDAAAVDLHRLHQLARRPAARAALHDDRVRYGAGHRVLRAGSRCHRRRGDCVDAPDHGVQHRRSHGAAGSGHEAEAVATKYARSALDAPARSRIRRKLAEAMTTRGLHRDNRVTLRALCESLKENPHYVSQVINQDLATNFYDLIKKHRVEDAMTALVTEPDKSVLDIALAVGFNSKSTFNAAFRQYAGMTPREYRASRKNAPDHVQTH